MTVVICWGCCCCCWTCAVPSLTTDWGVTWFFTCCCCCWVISSWACDVIGFATLAVAVATWPPCAPWMVATPPTACCCWRNTIFFNLCCCCRCWSCCSWICRWGVNCPSCCCLARICCSCCWVIGAFFCSMAACCRLAICCCWTVGCCCCCCCCTVLGFCNVLVLEATAPWLTCPWLTCCPWIWRRLSCCCCCCCCCCCLICSTLFICACSCCCLSIWICWGVSFTPCCCTLNCVAATGRLWPKVNQQSSEPHVSEEQQKLQQVYKTILKSKTDM